MRLLFLILLLANAVAIGYIRFAESRVAADNQAAVLQINPEKMKLVKPGTAPVEQKDKSATAPQAVLACLEWGTFAAEDAARATAALATLNLTSKVMQRQSLPTYWIHIPALQTRADALKKAAELKARGVGDFFVVQDTDPARFAISLGEFRSEENATAYFSQLTQKGVRSAIVAPRGARSTTFVINDPGDAVALKIAELKTEFPNAQLKAVPCADVQAAKN